MVQSEIYHLRYLVSGQFQTVNYFYLHLYLFDQSFIWGKFLLVDGDVWLLPLRYQAMINFKQIENCEFYRIPHLLTKFLIGGSYSHYI